MRLVNVQETDEKTTHCLAAAHALVRLDDGTIVGDPMEKTTLDALKWQLNKGMHYEALLPLLSLMNFLFRRGHCTYGCISPSSYSATHPSSFPVLLRA